jgi:hypothetical protein
MKHYGLRYLYKHLGKALKKLPFVITDHNKPVAIVIKPEDINKKKETK